ncbi:MAG TPA: hypothetical protein VEJ18_13380, partial [Planctomycetota bacterium]|nr:hypothetical protein [Planctomycetota bacterium]
MIGRGLLLVLAAALPAAPQQAQDDGVMVEDARKDVLDRLQRAEEARNWKEFWAHLTVASRRWGHHAVPVEPNRWISLREHLLARAAALPREAREAWRFEHDGAALEAFARAREGGRRVDLEQAVEEYFLSSQTDEVLDALSRAAFDEGRAEEAVAYGLRLLTLCPDSDIPPELVAARVAMAAVAAGHAPALAEIRRTAERRGLRGRVRVGGRDLELPDFLASLEFPARPEPPVTSKVPFAYAPGEQDVRRGIGVANDVLRWTYHFDKDRGDGSAPPENVPPQPVLRRFGRVPVPAAPPPGTEFPIFPAYARLHGREYLILSDGSRVTAVDPSRVQGTSTTAGVYWKYPVDRAVVR